MPRLTHIHGVRKNSGGCQGLKEGDDELLFKGYSVTFQDEKFWRLVAQQCEYTLNTTTNCILKMINGKFYVMCILPQKQMFKMRKISEYINK